MVSGQSHRPLVAAGILSAIALVALIVFALSGKGGPDHLDPLSSRDAHVDPRCSKNPLVLGAPYIRFYAGAPLITPEGLDLGTLCVIDPVPRAIGPEEAQALWGLARQAMLQLELRRTIFEVDAASDHVALD